MPRDRCRPASSSGGAVALEPDVDGDGCAGAPSSPCKRPKTQHDGASVVPGPSTYREMFQWPEQADQACSGHAAAIGMDTEAGSCLRGGKTIYLSTAYTGAFTVEHVCSCIQQTVSRRFEEPSRFVFWSAWDIDESCRRLIKQAKTPPQHLFGNVCDRLPEEVVKQMYFIQQTLLTRAQAQIQSEKASPTRRKQINETLGQRCKEKLVKLARKAYEKQDAGTAYDYCHIHNEFCCIDPPKDIPNSLRMEAGGNTCVAFSAANSTPWRWLHESAVPCICWLCCVEKQRPHFILQECSNRFDTADTMKLVFQPDQHWETHVVEFASSQIGVPTTRRRKYSWTLNTVAARMLCPYEDTFLAVMGSVVTLDGHVYFLESTSMKSAWVREQFKRRGVVAPAHCEDMAWEPHAVLPVGERLRLCKYEKALSASKTPVTIQPIFDLSQNASVRPAFTDTFFSLLRNSEPYSTRARRGMAATEIWGVQTIPHPDLFDEGDEIASAFPFPIDVVNQMSAVEVTTLMGNAMNARAVGMFTYFGLYFACLDRPSNDA